MVLAVAKNIMYVHLVFDECNDIRNFLHGKCVGERLWCYVNGCEYANNRE